MQSVTPKLIASPLVNATVAFVKDQLSSNDASHDWQHIERVWNLARVLAREERVNEEMLEIVDLAALLHDIDDWKYQIGETKTQRAKEFLHSQSAPDSIIVRVMGIINGMGFKEELGGEPHDISVEFGCVQDADRLDAIGAIGIARCFTYGGHKKRPLYDPDISYTTEITQEQYTEKSRSTPTINHFYEKLLKLRSMMKTNAGKRMADQRHAFMEIYLEQFFKEINGCR